MGPWRPNWCSQSAMSDAISALGPKRPMRQPSVFTVSGARHHFPWCARHNCGRCLARPPAPECVYMRSRGALGGPRAPKHVYMVLWCSLPPPPGQSRLGVSYGVRSPRKGRKCRQYSTLDTLLSKMASLLTLWAQNAAACNRRASLNWQG